VARYLFQRATAKIAKPSINRTEAVREGSIGAPENLLVVRRCVGSPVVNTYSDKSQHTIPPATKPPTGALDFMATRSSSNENKMSDGHRERAAPEVKTL
jgi:hypothetical protein